MKKLFLLSLVCMLGLTFVACEKKDDTKVITAEDIEEDEDFQKILLQTSMIRSDSSSKEDRVDMMLSLYRNCFEKFDGEKYATVVDDNYKKTCKKCVEYAFAGLRASEALSKLENLLIEPLEQYVDNNKEGNIDWDTLMPQLKEKALEIVQ